MRLLNNINAKMFYNLMSMHAIMRITLKLLNQWKNKFNELCFQSAFAQTGRPLS